MTQPSFDLNTYISKYKNNPFITTEKSSYRYQDFGHAVRQTVAKLQGEKIKSGEYVALIDEVSFNYIVNLFALIQIGAIAVLINPRHSLQQIQEQLEKIQCKKYIADIDLAKDFFRYNTSTEESHEMSAVSDNMRLNPVNLDQEATVIFTSGSGGLPKACLHSLGNHYYSALGSNENIKIFTNDSWLHILPIYHVGGLAIIFRTVLAGASLVIPEDRHDLAHHFQKFNITHVSVVPTQLYRLLHSDISSDAFLGLKAVLIGGDKVPSEMIARTVEQSLPVFTTYGSSEMSSQVTTTKPGDSLERLKTSGCLLSHRELQLDDDGEILVRGKTLFTGYLSGNEINSARDDDGWFRTGDVGLLYKNGYLSILGRKDNMFICGGENMHPEEIETHLLEIDGIKEALVVGIDDEEFGALPAAFLKTDGQELLPTEKISELLLPVLSKNKIPKKYFPWPQDEDPELKHKRSDFKILAKNILSGD